MSDNILIFGAPPTRIGATEGRMAAIEERYGELTGFTLFEHRGRGWQMSVRPKGEVGWIVKIIPDEQAKAIMEILSHDPRFAAKPEPNRFVGDGPFYGDAGDAGLLLGQMKAAEDAREALTAAIRAWTP